MFFRILCGMNDGSIEALRVDTRTMALSSSLIL
jgi:hypothetical protein